MNKDIRWDVPSDGHTFPIYAGPPSDMDRVAEYADERGVRHIRFGGDTWSLSADDGPLASAKTQTGTWTAQGNKDKFRTSDEVMVAADRHNIMIIAESRTDFVLDIDGEKAGQFTSGNRGLKNLHVEFEGPGEKLPLDVQIFVSWVARRCMESRMIGANTAVLAFLILCVIIAVLYWFV